MKTFHCDYFKKQLFFVIGQLVNVCPWTKRSTTNASSTLSTLSGGMHSLLKCTTCDISSMEWRSHRHHSIYTREDEISINDRLLFCFDTGALIRFEHDNFRGRSCLIKTPCRFPQFLIWKLILLIKPLKKWHKKYQIGADFCT